MRNQERILDLRINEHAQGYGLYVMVLELLRDAKNYRVKYRPEHIAFAMNESDVSTLKRVCENYDLFEISEDGYISSPWLTESMKKLEEKTSRYAAAGKAGAAARWGAQKNEEKQKLTANNNAKASLCDVNGDAIASQCDGNSIYINKLINKSTNHSTTCAWEVGGGVIVNCQQMDELCRDKSAPMTKTAAMKECKGNDDSHNRMMIIDIAHFFKLTLTQYKWLNYITQEGLIGGKETMELIKLYNKCKEDKFTAKYPMNYILSNFSGYKAARDGK